MTLKNLLPHPEGGLYREIFRSPHEVVAGDGRRRCALTHIYFALRPGEVSRFHRVTSDEVWNLYRGDGLRLITWDGQTLTTTLLAAAEESFCTIVPAGVWQAAEPLGREVLVGCSVAPGFDFVDFTLISPETKEADQILKHDNGLSRFIIPTT
ncbi:MAG: hypothetical protein C0621_03455 [Desulfuromonas sp.]|nr:MAG: hypothetical protein C0621_03455 [Desulfuromonas sp.]